jgi:hypothetical protein
VLASGMKLGGGARRAGVGVARVAVATEGRWVARGGNRCARR